MIVDPQLTRVTSSYYLASDVASAANEKTDTSLGRLTEDVWREPQTICITGGTGSFGQAFAHYLLTSTPHHVRVFSRDEHKQEEMWSSCPPGPRLTYIIGDVRDRERLRAAFDGADCVIHAAALKIVRTGEINPDEVMKTNSGGSHNVVEAALDTGVKKTLLISTDKAVSPINDYGVSKAQAERLFISGNVKGVSRACAFSVVRGGNVWGSRGSVSERWYKAALAGEALRLSNAQATRFHMLMAEWTRFCYRVLNEMSGGEIFVPILRAWNLQALADAFYPAKQIQLDKRNGDKLHETLINADEAQRTRNWDWACVIEPPSDIRAVWNYRDGIGDKMLSDVCYSSDNVNRLSVDELRRLIGETWK